MRERLGGGGSRLIRHGASGCTRNLRSRAMQIIHSNLTEITHT